MKFVSIVGTNADWSYNRKLLQYMKEHFSSEAQIVIQEIVDIPLFNENYGEQVPSEVAKIVRTLDTADGVIIASPEYDHSIPAALKSVLEWLSFKEHPLKNKPVMIVGASYGPQGSSRAQAHLRQILDSPGLGAYVLPGNEFLLNGVKDAFDENDQLIDKQTISFLEECFSNYVNYVQLIEQQK
ncbi:MAG: NADPH-dependent FMN reductase [Sporolactobacillus sp.]